MLAPKAAWGALIGGRAPTGAEKKAYASAYKTATRATAHPRSCPSLREAVYERPQSDLKVLLAARCFSAVRAWSLRRAQWGWPCR
eukprot:2023762-Alexandrium_andersonii.AAC.1